MQLLVRIVAQGVAPERLRTLVESSQRLSPVSCAMQDPVTVALRIQIGNA